MWIAVWIELLLLWIAWFYPFAFRAPHGQKRQSITALGPTRLGLLLETGAIFLALSMRVPETSPPGILRMAAALALGAVCCIFGWTAVNHLGKQFRVHAGLYVDHELVRTGPYSIVRHPIYASLFGMMLCGIILVTRWQWAIVSIVLFIVGTEIRVQTEERLLAGRFGPQFDDYRRRVSAYIPFIR
jgi:protein-S-isoprenylcysteine O-methyltransferase Ste14